MSIYYIYFYLRQVFTPYYVGKGSGNRCYVRNKTDIKPPKNKSKIILVEQNLTELQAFILERYYIRWFGRKDIETGILQNRTNGGPGIDAETSRRRVKEKTHHLLKKEDGTSFSSNLVKSKKHHLLKRPDGTSWGKTINIISVQNGTNPLLMRKDGTSIGKEINDMRVKNGTHHWFKNKNSVSCRNKNGICKRILKEDYHSQFGPMETWEWVSIASKEGKRRKITPRE